jgi:hypothetical protein
MGSPAPRTIEHADPGGISCTTRTDSWADIYVLHESELVDIEGLGAVDVNDAHRDELQLHFDR